MPSQAASTKAQVAPAVASTSFRPGRRPSSRSSKEIAHQRVHGGSIAVHSVANRRRLRDGAGSRRGYPYDGTRNGRQTLRPFEEMRRCVTELGITETPLLRSSRPKGVRKGIRSKKEKWRWVFTPNE
ncbi:hypothetical protein DL765_008503 [Monosporascus sp. GIB2]|nr:hypothetical protein DL765_008503 [Monosporascus sp. GIB2]